MIYMTKKCFNLSSFALYNCKHYLYTQHPTPPNTTQHHPTPPTLPTVATCNHLATFTHNAANEPLLYVKCADNSTNHLLPTNHTPLSQK